MAKKQTEWQEMPHPIWGEGGTESRVNEISGLEPNMFPRTIWRKNEFSIIPPCGITFEQYEAYDGEDIQRFDTLEEAKNHLDLLPKTNKKK